jgi:hypothetical protein
MKMRINTIVFIMGVLSILALTVLAVVPIIRIGSENDKIVTAIVKSNGTIVGSNLNISPKIPPNISPNIPSSPSSTSVIPSINIIEILTAVSIALAVVAGLLKILGRDLYIGSKKKVPYIDTLGIRKKLKKYLLAFKHNNSQPES